MELWTFGAGIGDCIGQRLAILGGVQPLIAVLLSKFTFEFNPRMRGMDGALNMAYNSLVAYVRGLLGYKQITAP